MQACRPAIHIDTGLDQLRATAISQQATLVDGLSAKIGQPSGSVTLTSTGTEWPEPASPIAHVLPLMYWQSSAILKRDDVEIWKR